MSPLLNEPPESLWTVANFGNWLPELLWAVASFGNRLPEPLWAVAKFGNRLPELLWPVANLGTLTSDRISHLPKRALSVLKNAAGRSSQNVVRLFEENGCMLVAMLE